jgi:hypothetical protein
MIGFRGLAALGLACAASALACGSASSSTGSSQDGNSSGGGSAGTPTKFACTTENPMASADQVCISCAESNCNSQYVAAFGSGYASFDFGGGACGALITCIAACACNDTQCILNCPQASSDCMAAEDAANACDTQNCPTCGTATSSSGSSGSSGGSSSSGGVSSSSGSSSGGSTVTGWGSATTCQAGAGVVYECCAIGGGSCDQPSQYASCCENTSCGSGKGIACLAAYQNAQLNPNTCMSDFQACGL